MPLKTGPSGILFLRGADGYRKRRGGKFGNAYCKGEAVTGENGKKGKEKFIKNL